MVCFEISANGKSLSNACVGETDQFEVALAKPIGDRDTTLSVTVFAARSRYHNKIYRIIEDNQGIEPYVKSNEDLEKEKESATFCSFCGKGDCEVGSMITGEEGVFICNECVELAVDIINAEKK